MVDDLDWLARRFPIYDRDIKEFWEWTIHLSGEEDYYEYCQLCIHYERCVIDDTITGQNRIIFIPSRCLHGPPSIDKYGVGVFPLMEPWQSCHQFDKLSLNLIEEDIITLVAWDCGGKKVYRKE